MKDSQLRSQVKNLERRVDFNKDKMDMLKDDLIRIENKIDAIARYLNIGFYEPKDKPPIEVYNEK